jgi:glycogen debranching enzyme
MNRPLPISDKQRRAGRSALILAALALFFPYRSAIAQTAIASQQGAVRPTLTEDTFASRRFLAVHGRRGVLQGYATEGLEFWAYPFQIFSSYRVAFRPSGATTAIDGAEILSRVIYQPDSITRVYIGPNFIAREELFVPLDRAGAIITYSMQSENQVKIEVHATPVMNLMWPAALGGQSVQWNPALSAFILAEPSHGFTAAFGSPQIAAHDDPGNRTLHGVAETGLGFTLHPTNSGVAQVYVALNPARAADPGLLLRELIRDGESLHAEAAAHTSAVLENTLQVETPDERINRVIAWTEAGLDQAWVCNPDLGCGYVAGYGPSRAERRPQYEWFFAGDGMVAADAAISDGDRDRARDELEFILRYQDAKTGMIWHELSQSASFVDWAGKFPYMFVHVDITFQFLGALDRYVTASGDIDFVRRHWQAIEAAYRYCLSTIDPSTGLPRIPADKEGGDEQDRMSDDLGLSTSWIAAASSFAHLAALTGHADLGAGAATASQRARDAVPGRYWDNAQIFWIAGHTLAGKAMSERRAGPVEGLTLHLFSPQQNAALLDQLASASFQTDWGTRSIASGSVGFDPESYGKGSVWTLGTANMAAAFWSEHRPITALAVWRSMLPLAWLDSPGHLHEVLAGDFYRPQIESVPEQTWSSAGFLDATIHGLLGIEVDSLTNTLVFAPRLPAEWRDLSIAHIRLSAAYLSLALHRDDNGLALGIDNPGRPCKFHFRPDVPLGASLVRATLNHKAVPATIENHAQQTEAQVNMDVPHGKSELRVDLRGGISVIPEMREPHAGDPSVGLHVVDVVLAERRLSVTADVPADRESHLRLKTVWKIEGVDGATLQTVGPGLVELTVPATAGTLASYRRAVVTMELTP